MSDEEELDEVVTDGPLWHLSRLNDYQESIDILLGLGERGIAHLVAGRLRLEAQKLEDCLGTI